MVASVLALALLSTWAFAQFGGGRGGGGRRQMSRDEFPTWELPRSFEKDTFTFARVQYGPSSRGGGWRNDYPDGDWNLSLRLQQLTSLQVDPNGVVVQLTDDNLGDYPFLYMSNVQGMSLTRNQAESFRKYLHNGGFVMADDFWTPSAWRHVQREMERVLPGRKPRELTIDHPIFNIVYEFTEIPRVPSIMAWNRGLIYEDWHGSFEGDSAPHFHGYFDDDGRLMA